MVSPKKIHTTWKFRVQFYSVGMLGLSLRLGDSISGDPKWADSEEAGEKPRYIQGCSKGQVICILKVIVAQSCLTLCNPMDCSLPGSSVHGILQARLLEWVAISFSRGFVKKEISGPDPRRGKLESLGIIISDASLVFRWLSSMIKFENHWIRALKQMISFSHGFVKNWMSCKFQWF